MSSACCAACGASCAAAAASCAACGAGIAAVTVATAAAASAHRKGDVLAPVSAKKQATLLLVAGLFIVLGVAVVAWVVLTQH